MTGLEGIIRPYETGDISPAKPVPTSDTVTPPANLVINPGKDGSAKTFSGSYNLTINYYYIKTPTEKKKTS